MGNPGRTTADVKIDKSVGTFPFTNLIAISCRFDADKNYYQLASTLLKELPHNQLESSSKVKLASTSDDDDVAGIGARLVGITGLKDGELFTELVFTDGKTPVETINEFDKITSLLALEFGTNVNSDTGDSEPVGDIYCGTGTFTNGIPDAPIVVIDSDYHDTRSREGIFTIPDGKYAFIRDYFVTVKSAVGSVNNSVDFQLVLKPFGAPSTFWLKVTEFFYTNTYNYKPEAIVIIPPNFDLQLRVQKIVANHIGTATMTLELQDIRG